MTVVRLSVEQKDDLERSRTDSRGGSWGLLKELASKKNFSELFAVDGEETSVFELDVDEYRENVDSGLSIWMVLKLPGVLRRYYGLGL